MSEPCDLTAVAARRLIGAKRLAPSELLESCIARIEAVDHAVNAMVARDFDRARAGAKAADAAVLRGDALGPLHGLPIGVKDLQETGGLVTTHGSVIFRDHVPAQDERLVAAVRGAGAIVVGKTNTPEFGAGANTRNAVYGATGNPFDPMKSCAGSSGGSAVALATGMVPICTGSDTGGSLRNPASFCGIVGFRPTPGLVPSERRGLGWSNLSVLGPMARTVPDLALLLSCMVSDDARDPLATTVHGATIRRAADFAAPAPIDLSRLRVALTPDFGFAPTERHIAEVFAEKTDVLRIVAETRDGSFGLLPHRLGDLLRREAFHVQRTERPGATSRLDGCKQGLGATAVDEGLGVGAAKQSSQVQQPCLVLGPDVDPLAVPLRDVAQDAARARAVRVHIKEGLAGADKLYGDVLHTRGATGPPRPRPPRPSAGSG